MRQLHCVHRHLLPSRSRSPVRAPEDPIAKIRRNGAQFFSVPSPDPSGAERGREERTCTRLDGVDLEEQHHHAEEVGHVPRQPEHVHLRSPSFTFPPPPVLSTNERSSSPLARAWAPGARRRVAVFPRASWSRWRRRAGTDPRRE